MSQEGPKLYTHKPKKAQIKAKSSASPTAPTPSPSPTPKPTPSSASSSMSAAEAAAASYKVGGSPPPPLPPPPTPQPPKESFARRYKFLWPLLLTVNLGVGAYLFMRTSKKEDTGPKEEASTDAPSTPVSFSPTTAPATEKPTSLPAIPVAVTVAPREPIPENEQRELFKWILEEKRKLKPKHPEEKKRIDEEKAILKQILRSNHLPSI